MLKLILAGAALKSQELLHALKKKKSQRNYLKSWWTSPPGKQKAYFYQPEKTRLQKVTFLLTLTATIKHQDSDLKTKAASEKEAEMPAEG